MEAIKKATEDKGLRKLLYAKRGTEQMPIIDTRNGSFSSDTMFYELRGKPRAIFCAIELTSRIGFIRLYRREKPNAEECVGFLQELKKSYPFNALSTDPGVEYKNSLVKEFCKDNNIELHFYDVAEKTEKAIIERFNRSIRELLTVYTMKVGWNWKDALTDIETFYNHRFHSTIKMKPIDVEPKDRKRIILEASRKAEQYRAKLNGFTPGTRVRVWVGADPEKSPKELATQEFNKKFGARWTTKIYIVIGTKGYKVSLEGTSKRISPRDLLIVPKDEIEHVEKIDVEATKARATRKATRKLNKEGLYEVSKLLAENKPLPEVAKVRAKPKATIATNEIIKESDEINEIVGHRGANEKFELNVDFVDSTTPHWISLPALLINPANHSKLMMYLKKNSQIRNSGIKDYLDV